MSAGKLGFWKSKDWFESRLDHSLDVWHSLDPGQVIYLLCAFVSSCGRWESGCLAHRSCGETIVGSVVRHFPSAQQGADAQGAPGVFTVGVVTGDGMHNGVRVLVPVFSVSPCGGC